MDEKNEGPLSGTAIIPKKFSKIFSRYPLHGELLAVRAPKCPSGFVPYRGAAVNIFDAKPVKVLQNDVHVLS